MGIYNAAKTRYNRTLLNKARCLIFDSSFGKDFWEEAVAISVYLTNRTPTSAVANNKTPAELWYKQTLNLEKIRIFGSTSYVHIPFEDRRNKLDPRSQKMYLVGYTDNGYRLWNPIERKIISTRNVIFAEKIMYNGNTTEECRSMDNIANNRNSEINTEE